MRAFYVVAAALIVSIPSAVALSALPLALDPGEVLVGYAPGRQNDLIDLVETLGGQVLSTNEDLRFAVVDATSVTRFLAGVVLSPIVEYAERNDATRQTGAQWNGAQWNGAQWNGAQWNGAQWNGEVGGDPGASAQWGLVSVRAEAAWNVTTGTRTAKLCVIDSGIEWDHPDLAANIWSDADGTHGYNAIDPRASPYDDGGHGTHMAGIAAAVVRNGIGVAGIGNVSVMSAKVLGSDGTGKEDALARGILWCANHGADVALMSLSADNEGPTVRNALAYAARHDVLLVASAGNTGACTDCVAYPARDANVIAVSALQQDSTLASFSSRGPQVELAAPGVGIHSTFLNEGYASGSGTSQAAAFVAGAAALLRDARPDLSAAGARAALDASARDLGPAGKDPRFGHGAVDIGKALAGME